MTLNKYIDHTMLKPDATKSDIDQVVQEALDNDLFSVMVNPYWVEYVCDKLKNSTVKTACVIGFPLGANTTKVKAFEAEDAIKNGADELDMVINIGEFKHGNDEIVKRDIEAVVEVGHKAEKLVKVIIETALLSDEEISRASRLVDNAGAEFVKTSTGFSSRGASVHDVTLMKDAISGETKVKASGGIHTKAEAEEMVAAGAERLGVSASMAILGKK